MDYEYRSAAEREELLETLRSCRWRAQLCGGHGSGKSTLLRTLLKEETAAGRAVALWCWTEQRPFPNLVWFWRVKPGGIAAVDSAERVVPWLLLLMHTWARIRRSGFLITVHKPQVNMRVTLNVSANLRPIEQRARARFSCRAAADRWLQNLEQRLAEHQGDARAMLFQLYDEYERSPAR